MSKLFLFYHTFPVSARKNGQLSEIRGKVAVYFLHFYHLSFAALWNQKSAFLGRKTQKRPIFIQFSLNKGRKLVQNSCKLAQKSTLHKNCMGSFICRFSVYWKIYLPNFYIPYKINHNSKPVFSVSLSIRKCGRLCRVCDRYGASVCAEGTRNTFLGKEDTES